jgi:hypothetical protein
MWITAASTRKANNLIVVADVKRPAALTAQSAEINYSVAHRPHECVIGAKCRQVAAPKDVPAVL